MVCVWFCMYFLSLIQPNIAQTVEIHMYNLYTVLVLFLFLSNSNTIFELSSLK